MVLKGEKGNAKVVASRSRPTGLSLWIYPVLIAVGFFFLTISGVRELKKFNQLAQKRESLIVHNQALNAKNEEMYREISRLKNDPIYLEEIARKEFGLVKPDEIIFYIEEGPIKEANPNASGTQSRQH
ncbi:MAG: septum formation initiator family protein [Thermodesulfobacteriota bacterium]